MTKSRWGFLPRSFTLWFGEWWPELLFSAWVGGFNVWALIDPVAIGSLGVSVAFGELAGFAYTAAVAAGALAIGYLTIRHEPVCAAKVMLLLSTVIFTSGITTIIVKPDTAKGASGAYVGLSVLLMAVVWLRGELRELRARVAAREAEILAAKSIVAAWGPAGTGSAEEEQA